MIGPSDAGGLSHNIERFAPLLFAVFLLALLLDVGGAFGIKQGATILVLGYLLLAFGRLRIPVEVVLVEGVLFGLFPGVLLLVALAVYHVAPRDAVSELSYLATWAIFPLIVTMPSEKMVATLRSVIICGAVLTIVAFVGLTMLHVLGASQLVADINEFTFRNRLGFFGQRPVQGTLLGFVPNVYFRWSMLLIPGVTLLAGKRNGWLTIVAIAMALTLSTGVALFGIVGLVLLGAAIQPEERRAVWWTIVLSLGAGAIVLAVVWVSPYRELLDLAITKAQDELSGNSVRFGHVASILRLWRDSALGFLFGDGVGSAFFSEGTGEFVNNVEVSHLNLVRQYGAVFALLFVAYLVHVSLRLLRSGGDGPRLAVGLWTLFLAAGTNPLLLSPIFFTVLVVCRAYGFSALEGQQVGPLV